MSKFEWTKGITLKHVESCLIKSALEKHSYDIAATARSLGISRSAIYKKIFDVFGMTIVDLRKSVTLDVASGQHGS